MVCVLILASHSIASSIADYAAVVAALAAAAGLLFAGIEVRHSRRELEHARGVATADALLSFDALLVRFDAVQLRIIRQNNPREQSRARDTELLTRDERAEIRRYMGLLERLKVMLDKDLLDISTVDRLYGFRIRSIMDNTTTRKWLENDRHKDDSSRGWRDFCDLADDLQSFRDETFTTKMPD